MKPYFFLTLVTVVEKENNTKTQNFENNSEIVSENSDGSVTEYEKRKNFQSYFLENSKIFLNLTMFSKK